jgi:hypothetical protein
MLKIINEDLFSFILENCNSEMHGDFVKLSIQTSRSIVKGDEGNDRYIPSVRTFARLISPDKEYSKYNLGVSSKQLENNSTQILFKCTPDVKNNNLIYLVAFPFNGIIKPIPESKEYRILKGMISSSEQYSVLYNNKKYKKVLYLILSLRQSVLDNKPEAYIPFSVESYAYYKDGNGGVSTIKETLSVDMYSDRGEMNFVTEETNPIDLDVYRDKKIFTTYRRPDKNYGEQATGNTNVIKTRPSNFTKSYYTTSQKPDFSKDNDSDYPKKKTGGNPNRKKKVKR